MSSLVLEASTVFLHVSVYYEISELTSTYLIPPPHPLSCGFRPPLFVSPKHCEKPGSLYCLLIHLLDPSFGNQSPVLPLSSAITPHVFLALFSLPHHVPGCSLTET